MLKHLSVCVPKDIVDRSDLNQEELKNFETITGIKKTRRFSGSTWNMIEKAIDSSQIPTHGIDALIVVTQSPDRLSPCMAMQVHKKLKLPSNIPAFDISHACDGWIMGLYVASQLQRKTLLVCADRLRYNKTPLESLMFSDSVSFTVVPAFFNPTTDFLTEENVEILNCGLNGETYMDGAAVTEFVAGVIPPAIRKFKDEEGLTPDLLIPHSANWTLIRLLEIRSEFKGRTLYSIQEYGNLSLNSVPMTVAFNEEKCLNKKILLAGFGAGMSAAFMKFKWCEEPISKIVEF